MSEQILTALQAAMLSDRKTNGHKAAIYDHLHQPGEITQEFADVVNCVHGSYLRRPHKQENDDEWFLLIGNSRSLVTTISQVLLILHAFGVEIEWPKSGNTIQ